MKFGLKNKTAGAEVKMSCIEMETAGNGIGAANNLKRKNDIKNHGVMPLIASITPQK